MSAVNWLCLVVFLFVATSHRPSLAQIKLFDSANEAKELLQSLSPDDAECAHARSGSEVAYCVHKNSLSEYWLGVKDTGAIWLDVQQLAGSLEDFETILSNYLRKMEFFFPKFGLSLRTVDGCVKEATSKYKLKLRDWEDKYRDLRPVARVQVGNYFLRCRHSALGVLVTIAYGAYSHPD
jgi:hypothetical protein